MNRLRSIKGPFTLFLALAATSLLVSSVAATNGLICDPLTAGYWTRQCLGTGEIRPGQNGRGPAEPTEPDFVSTLEPCAEAWLEGRGFFGVTTCEGLDAVPPSDACEKALKQLTALILNVCSGHLDRACSVDTSPEGCLSTTVGYLVDEAAALIQNGQCQRAAACAAAVNEGTALP